MEIDYQILIDELRRLIQGSGGSFSFTLKLFGLLSVAAFMPLTAYGLRGTVNRRRGQEFEQMVDAYDLRETISYKRLAAASPTLAGFRFRVSRMLGGPKASSGQAANNSTVQSIRSRDAFFVPTCFATVLCLLGSSVFIFGYEMGLANAPNLIFAGSFHSDDPMKVLEYQRITVAAIGFGFMGSYVMSMYIIMRRMMTVDLTPSVYYSVSLRIIFSCLAAICLRHAVSALPSDRESLLTALMPVIAFLGGMFPDLAVSWLKERTIIFSERGKHQADPLELKMIEGLSVYKRVRLSEIAIDNAQNLANTNVLELVFRTPYRLSMVIDWIAQAQLFVEFRQTSLTKLRGAGIRTAFDFLRATGNEIDANQVSAATDIPLATIKHARHSLNCEPAFLRLAEVRAKVYADNRRAPDTKSRPCDGVHQQAAQ